MRGVIRVLDCIGVFSSSHIMGVGHHLGQHDDQRLPISIVPQEPQTANLLDLSRLF